MKVEVTPEKSPDIFGDRFQLLISGSPGDAKQPVENLYLSVDLSRKGAERLHARLGKALKRKPSAKKLAAAESRQ